MTKIRVFIVDDHTILRDGLRALIEVQPDLCVVGEAADGDVALAGVAELQPDVVVMDISMPRLGGADATEQIRRACPAVRVLALTAHENGEYVQLLLEAGASGYLLKRAAASDLVRAIRAVAAGHLYLDTTVSHDQHTPQAPAPLKRSQPALSEREADVLRMIALGHSMKEMASSLDLSPRTIETYKKRAMEKRDLGSRADIVRFALEQGWLKDG
jgi:DNA-binding NarL/FixJ family response regulator